MDLMLPPLFQTTYYINYWSGLKTFLLLVLLGFSATGLAQDRDSTIRVYQKLLIAAGEDTARISLLLKLGDFYGNQTSAYQHRALFTDLQALTLSEKLKCRKWQNKCLLQLAIQYGILRDFKRSRQSYLSVLNYCDNRHDLKQSIAALSYLWQMFRWGPNRNVEMLNETVWCLRREQEAYIKLGDSLRAILCLKEEGDANLNMGKLNVAENQLLEVLVTLKTKHYLKLYDTYFLLAAVNHLKGNLNKNLYYCIETVKSAEADKNLNLHTLGLFYLKLARVYAELGMLNNSILIYNKLLSLDEINNVFNPLNKYIVCYEVCQIMISQHKPVKALGFLQKQALKIHPEHSSDKSRLYKGMAACYIALKRNSAAEAYLLKMIEVADYNLSLIGEKNETRFQDFMQVCEFYISLKNYDKASYYLQKTLAVPEIDIRPLDLSKVQLLQFKVDSALHHFVSAIRHFEIYKRLTDSIFNVDESKQVASIQANYETERKDKDILLLKKQSLIDHEKYKGKRIMSNMLIAVIVLLVILMIALYSRYLLKQQNVLVLQQNQKEISAKNQALEKLLNDNEWLLKEVHHRIKNNLQTVTSLLHTQLSYLKEETALNAVMDSQHRIQAMSLIHQKLYKSSNSSSIHMPEYIGELVDYLKESFKIGLRILFHLEIEPVMFDVVLAIPVGLILNELITNAVKYAFPFSENDAITIKLFYVDRNFMQLEFLDNGRGFPENFDTDQHDSFGLTLIRGLIEDLNGTFLLENVQGTKVTIRFDPEERIDF